MRSALALPLMLLLACGGAIEDPRSDGGHDTLDGAVPDASAPDASEPDAAVADASTPDASTADDAGAADSGARDAGQPLDAGPADAGRDAGGPGADAGQDGGPFALAMGVDWVNTNNGTAFELPRTAATQAIARDTVVFQDTHIMGFAAGVGTSATASTAFASYDGLAALDARIALMRLARRLNGQLVITLCGAPWWMQDIAPGTANGYALSLSTPISPAHEQAFADFAAFLAQRYPDVGYFTVWNELKGYYLAPPANHWDYVGYTRMFNKVSAAIKAVRPDAKVGGPYPSVPSYPTGSGGRPPQATDGTQVSGPGWFVDGRTLDVFTYFAANAVGVDYLTWDAGILDLPGVDDSEKLRLLPLWIAQRFPGKPQFIMESYWHDGSVANLQTYLAKTKSSGKVAAMFLWHQNPTLAGQLWNSSEQRTPIGDAFAAWTAQYTP